MLKPISGYLCCCHLVRFDQSGPSPPTSHLQHIFALICFLHVSLQTLAMWNFQEISSFWDTSTALSGNNNRSGQSHLNPISSPFWNLVWTSWQWLHAFMHLFAAAWLVDLIFALTSWCTALPNEVLWLCVCIYSPCRNFQYSVVFKSSLKNMVKSWRLRFNHSCTW